MRRIGLVLAAVATVLAMADAWSRRWVGDDAFISFRYARNWVDGHGLVFNVGERVEGYTNFLWTLWIGLGLALEVDPVLMAAVSSIAAFGATLLLLAAASQRLGTLPLAALAWAACAHARIYATSGLETALFTLLVTATVLGAAFAKRPGAWALVGVIGVLAGLTRPDGVLFLGLAGVVALTQSVRERRPGAALAVSLPGVILLAYAAWKLSFYGDLRPNTYYAKSAYLSWWDQGLAYVLYWLGTYPILSLGPLLALAAAMRTDGEARKLALLCVAAPLVYLTYIAKVGGDFMFGRFCVPVAPLMLIGLERALASMTRERSLQLIGTVGAVGAMLLAPGPNPEKGAELGISDEWTQYPRALVEDSKRVALELRVLFDGVEPAPSIVIYGRQAMLAYYAGFPYVIEGVTGLTDPEIAHMELAERGRPGHEKQARPVDLQRRGVDLMLAYPTPMPPGGYTEIALGPCDGRLVTYDRVLLAQLRARGARFIDFEGLLDQYLDTIEQVPPADRAADFAAFSRFYFDHNPDEERRARFKAAL